MNERIRELAEQARGTKKHVPPVWQFYDIELEKFAQLIIRECGIVGDNWVDNEDNGKNRISDKFRQHFGVKEL